MNHSKFPLDHPTAAGETTPGLAWTAFDVAPTAAGYGGDPSTETPAANDDSKRHPGAPTLDALQCYMQDLERMALLSAEEELRQTQKIDASSRSLRALLQADAGARDRLQTLAAAESDERIPHHVTLRVANECCSQLPQPSRCRQLQRTLERARDRLIQSNLRLVFHIAQRYRNRGVPISDLIQDGNIGLIKAADRFDPALGYRFSTYAFWWIDQEVRLGIKKRRHLVKSPVYLADDVMKLHALSARLTQQLGRAPKPHELANEAAMTPARVVELLHINKPMVSMQLPVGADAQGELGDFLAAEALPADEAMTQRDHQHLTQQALAQLSAREARVLAMRYGIGYRSEYTLREIAEQLGVTTERVRQIAREALNKLRHQAAASAETEN